MSALFKYVWPFSGHQALKGTINYERYSIITKDLAGLLKFGENDICISETCLGWWAEWKVSWVTTELENICTTYDFNLFNKA